MAHNSFIGNIFDRSEWTEIDMIEIDPSQETCDRKFSDNCSDKGNRVEIDLLQSRRSINNDLGKDDDHKESEAFLEVNIMKIRELPRDSRKFKDRIHLNADRDHSQNVAWDGWKKKWESP